MIITVHRVVVQLSGDQISAAKAFELVNVVNNNANALSLQVRNVVAGSTVAGYSTVVRNVNLGEISSFTL